MSAKRVVVDTNVLVRFFTGSPLETANRAQALVSRADAGEISLVLLPVIVAETFYTLESFYKLPRKTVAAKLLHFLECGGIETVDKSLVIDALERCRQTNVHLADAFVASYAAQAAIPVASFDPDFEKFTDVQRADV